MCFRYAMDPGLVNDSSLHNMPQGFCGFLRLGSVTRAKNVSETSKNQ